MPELLNRREAAKAMRISLSTIDRLRRSGDIRYNRIGDLVYFTPQQIEDYNKSSERNTGAQNENSA